MPRLLPLTALPLFMALTAFTPFAAVQDVCPSCQKPPTDEVKLSSGLVVRGKVVAQNDDYYVVARLGEQRAVMKSEIASIKWAAGKPAQLPPADQVLLKNGVVLSGSIAEEQPGRLLVIEVGSSRHIVWFGQIEKLHKNGKPQDLAAPAPPPAPSTPTP